MHQHTIFLPSHAGKKDSKPRLSMPKHTAAAGLNGALKEKGVSQRILVLAVVIA